MKTNRKMNYTHTITACFIGYIVQAIVNNFVPLLFLTFQKQYGIPLSQITLLITINFGIQLLIDLASAGFVDKIGYRASVVCAHVLAAGGLILLTFLPELYKSAFIGILIAVAVYAVGGGLIEVLISPIVEACPTDNKEKAMSLLHSFYCWGYVAVVLVSTVFFAVFGVAHWKILALAWAVIPVINTVLFLKVPITSLSELDDEGIPFRSLITKKVFWILMLMMLCAGASEQSVSQWASTFAESGLGVSKTVGDLAGPMMFALLMGLSRLFYGKFGEKINLHVFMAGSAALCVASYLCISFSANPVLGLAGCGLCGLSVGIMWPGTFSKAGESLRGGGTALYALLALAGDLGCSGGPTLAGNVSAAFGDNLKAGILAAIVFPVLMLVGLFLLKKAVHAESKNPPKKSVD